MDGESKKAIKYLTNQPAIVHNYGKLNKSESPRTHSSPTSILRKFPHSLRHDQKHQTKIKRDSLPVNMIISISNRKSNRNVKSWCIGDDDSEDRPSSDDSTCEDLRKKRKFSESSVSSDCSVESEIWKVRSAVGNLNKHKSVQRKPQNGGSPCEKPKQNEQTEGITCIKKLSVINNSVDESRVGSVDKVPKPRKRIEFPVHKSTPNLLRSETFVSGSFSQPERFVDRSSGGRGRAANRHMTLKESDSLPQLDQRYRIIHSILPKINRTISESHESLSSLKKRNSNHVKSESQISSENYYNSVNRIDSLKIFDVGNKSDGSQSDEESEGLSLIDSQRNIIIQSPKDRKDAKNRWSVKRTVDIMPSLLNFMSRKNRGSSNGVGNGAGGVGVGGGSGDVVESTPPGASAPLMTSESPKSDSFSSPNIPQIRYFDEDNEEDISVKKCETVSALTNLIRADSMLQVEPIKPINRLRVPPNGAFGSTSRMCSRCSSLLSMASSSRYSINTTGSGFVNCSSSGEKLLEPVILCKLCLMEVPVSLSMEINNCECVFCKDCMRLYVEFEIQEGAYDISCPDAQCRNQGVVSVEEVETLVTSQMMERYLRFRLNHEVDMDRNRTWCPRAGCETVCNICPREKCAPTSVHCPTCDSDFCSNCKNSWHQGLTCEENSRKLAKEGRLDFMEPGIPFDSDSIKCCPMCNVPIEKDEGCAQMMCKRCKHVFCWYCLASLDDDFLLRHYDKGPCKNKLGHSRASVIWHRTQVIGIFAGLGLLLLVASPLLLLAAPCIVCCKCRVCSGTKLDAEDELQEESTT